MEEMRGAGFAGSAPPFRGRERAAVDIDVCPACPSSKIFKNDDDDDEACRFPVRVQKQQAQQLAVNAASSAGDGRQ